MKKMKMFYLEHCPFCKRAFQYINELKAEHPELAAIKRRLYEEGAVYASMSGSGSALFSLQRPQGKKKIETVTGAGFFAYL